MRVLVEETKLVGVTILDRSSLRVPPLATRPPVNVLAVALFKTSVPAPALVMLYALAGPIAPPTVRVPAFTVTVLFAPIVTAPAPRLRSFEPKKVKSLDQIWA